MGNGRLNPLHTMVLREEDKISIPHFGSLARLFRVKLRLFGTTRDRVNRMGGVGAWKEREREASERTMKWDLEERQAEREKMEEAKENGEIDDEVYDRYAEMEDEQGRGEVQDNIPKAADDDVS